MRAAHILTTSLMQPQQHRPHHHTIKKDTQVNGSPVTVGPPNCTVAVTATLTDNTTILDAMLNGLNFDDSATTK